MRRGTRLYRDDQVHTCFFETLLDEVQVEMAEDWKQYRSEFGLISISQV